MVDECGDVGYTSTTGGVIMSPSYQDNYPDNTRCIYTITQPIGTVILLKFLSMDIDDGGYTHCNFGDYLEIRDGPSTDSPLLDKVCGSKIIAPIQSSLNQLRIR